jgi:hypothetical protein
MARYGQAMKDRVVARLRPPESLPIETLSQEVGISVTTLERWRGEAVVATAALDEAGQNAWCREHGLYRSELERWRQGASEALTDPGEARASRAVSICGTLRPANRGVMRPAEVAVLAVSDGSVLRRFQASCNVASGDRKGVQGTVE